MLETDGCARVATHGNTLEVKRAPLTCREGQLALGEPQAVRILRQVDGRGFASDVGIGHVVSIHRCRACDRLGAHTSKRLETATRAYLALANAAWREGTPS